MEILLHLRSYKKRYCVCPQKLWRKKNSIQFCFCFLKVSCPTKFLSPPTTSIVLILVRGSDKFFFRAKEFDGGNFKNISLEKNLKGKATGLFELKERKNVNATRVAKTWQTEKQNETPDIQVLLLLYMISQWGWIFLHFLCKVWRA